MLTEVHGQGWMWKIDFGLKLSLAEPFYNLVGNIEEICQLNVLEL